MKKLLPILLALFGIGVGVGAGIALRPAPTPVDEASVEGGSAHAKPPTETHDASEGPPKGREYVKLVDQFIVPVVSENKVSSLILVTLTLEAKSGNSEKIFSAEPRIRGALLQAMFDHANVGGFDGAFTNSSKLDRLRHTFLEVAQASFGDDITDVVIVQITRQDV